MSLQIEVFHQITHIEASQWNALVQDNNPFLRYEFLAALETHDCVGEKFGWFPRHIAVYQNKELIAAMPLYEKYNTYGEFVFDQSWADAWQQHGLRYYPKLVSAIPYTPALGQRLLVSKDVVTDEIYPLLIKALKEVTSQLNASGFHILFPQEVELKWLKEQGMLIRHDCQFHWHNKNYTCFDDFLNQLSSRKRKNIIKERQTVKKAGVTLKRLNGHQASEQDWQKMAHFYTRTFNEKWGTPTLNYDFFQEVANKLPSQIVLVLAEQADEVIAGALMFCSDNRLYGRFWGCDKTIKGLHFEACYYQGIEYCIENKLAIFEPGAQGEHKISRGFVPTLTRSAHYLMQNPFEQSIIQFIEHEKINVLNYIDDVNKHLPYKKQSS
ncbi:MAG: GNAT family N-acetyltransferase [Gammaproteobacteria bacterium]|nr:GNAT family N-acetyltransferase [Gammaproteobacteria bacterium]